MPPAPSRRTISKSARRFGSGLVPESVIAGSPRIVPRARCGGVDSRTHARGRSSKLLFTESFGRVLESVTPVVALALLGAPGCAGGGAGANQPAKSAAVVGPITPTPVDDAAFAASTYRVLVGNDSGVPHLSLLAGAVARQLERAGARFRAGEDESGFAALEGAFLLMRRGEFRREGLVQAGPVLERGASEAARFGQEGYSLALYSLLDGMLPNGPLRADVETHLKAMAAFSASGGSTGPITTAGAQARVALQRALLDGSDERFDEASKLLVAWLERAHTSAVPDQPIRSNAERDEALEAFRAIRGGAFAVLALYLRHGDPLGALTTLDEAGFDRSLPADLRTRLEACAEDNDPGCLVRPLSFLRFVAGQKDWPCSRSIRRCSREQASASRCRSFGPSRAATAAPCRSRRSSSSRAWPRSRRTC